VEPAVAMIALGNLINAVINIFILILIVQAIMSWLIAFNVVNTRNRFVYMLADITYKITEPVLRPIRRILPNFGGIDLSPIVLILLLYFIRDLLFEYVIFA
jgi:YggT family protein